MKKKTNLFARAAMMLLLAVLSSQLSGECSHDAAARHAQLRRGMGTK